mgnify:CR=1 FL=1
MPVPQHKATISITTFPPDTPAILPQGHHPVEVSNPVRDLPRDGPTQEKLIADQQQ